MYFRAQQRTALFDFTFRCSIDVDMKSTVYCNAISNGNEEEWDFAWERYKGSNVATEKRSLLGGLSCTSKIWLLNRYEKSVNQRSSFTVVICFTFT